jgi:hypothetical protein
VTWRLEMNVETWKRTTTLDLRRTHSIDMWNSRENTSEENENGEAKTLKVSK